MKLLLIEEADSGAREALGRLKAEVDDFDYVWAQDLASAIRRLEHPDIDVILTSLALPDAWGTEAFEKAHAFAAHLPIVVLASSESDEAAASCITLGAQDSITVSEMEPPVLGRVLRYASERHRLITALRDLSVVDDQTELYTMTGFVELGSHHLRTAQRMGQNVVLVYVEAATHSGPAVMEAAQLLRTVLRGSDVIARVGPAEFAVLAVDAEPDAAPALVQRILEEAAERTLHGGLATSSLSVSHTSLQELPGASVNELLDRARSSGTRQGRQDGKRPTSRF